jgi:hypothetical protein
MAAERLVFWGGRFLEFTDNLTIVNASKKGEQFGINLVADRSG